MTWSTFLLVSLLFAGVLSHSNLKRDSWSHKWRKYLDDRWPQNQEYPENDVIYTDFFERIKSGQDVKTTPETSSEISKEIYGPIW
ncbi:unnamed protein product [Caenorhabditis angaria]|uniref:Uncharacterized protein n=1 Tax=Caenorhabditis angaria TaxID=860376 RepID=A0A9P1J1M2_9PELO|nr:unnamed protein product [Caenorhabditis angaria]